MRAREMERLYDDARRRGDHAVAAQWAAALSNKYAARSIRLAVLAMVLAVVSLAVGFLA